jgi:hypothetical protein
MAKRPADRAPATSVSERPPDAGLRRDQMLEAIRERHFLHVRELVSVRISGVTVRSDLDVLDSRGGCRFGAARPARCPSGAALRGTQREASPRRWRSGSRSGSWSATGMRC